MKTITRISLTILLMVGIVTSCKDYLEVNPVSSFGPDFVFGSVVNAEKALIGAYSAMGGDAGYGIRISMYYPYDNDEMMGQGGGGSDNERRDIAHYNVTAGNTQLANPFNQLYLGIERSNLCIYYIPRMDQYNNGSPEEQTALKKLHGEALTLRAQYYYELIRNWGDVPAQFLPSAFEPELFKEREDRDVIYAQLLDDLAVASTLVPWRSQAGTNDERITQGAVRGLRARIALARGGYSLRNSSNLMERTSDYKTYYQIARDETNAIIQSGEHKLNPSFQAVFKDAICAHLPEPNGELMWLIGMTGGSSQTGDSKLSYYNGPRANGIGNSALTILPAYFYLFEPTDTRRDVTCAPFDFNLNLTLVGKPLTSIFDGKFRRNWITNPVPNHTVPAQYYQLDWPLLRYSDVLLMFAEAENEINNGPTPAAITAFETVRKRAFGGTLVGTTPSDYAGFFNAITIERSLELGSEGIRKYDLIRWNLLATKLNEAKVSLANFTNRTGTFVRGSLPATNIAITTLPTSMYFVNASTTSTALKDMFTNDLYTPTPGIQPPGTTSFAWTGSATITTTLTQIFAIGFTPNKNELLPIHASVLDSNPLLAQNFGF